MSFIHLNQVSLDYIVKTGSDSLKKTLMHWLYPNRSSKPSIRNSCFRALDNINLQIHQGDRVGLIGRNGAGKSTLLRVLAKIYQPNQGTLSIQGKITNLFDVNLGLNTEASGFENIVSLGIMRGLSKRRAERLIPEVAEFTELGDFLHAPVRTYSTGMQMKLAFAVATAEHPDIVLIDEIIGAGDAQFMAKAEKRLHDLVERSHILVLTSHSTDIIQRMCNKIVVLDQGRLQFYGDLAAGLEFYESMG